MKKLIFILLTLFIEGSLLSRLVQIEVYKVPPLLRLTIKSFAKKAIEIYDLEEGAPQKQRFEAMHSYLESLKLPVEIIFGVLYPSIISEFNRSDIIINHLFELRHSNPEEAIDWFLQLPKASKKNIVEFLIINDIVWSIDYASVYQIDSKSDVNKKAEEKRDKAFALLKFFLQKIELQNFEFDNRILKVLYRSIKILQSTTSALGAQAGLSMDQQHLLTKFIEFIFRIENDYLNPLIDLIKDKYKGIESNYVEPDKELQEMSEEIFETFNDSQNATELDVKTVKNEKLEELLNLVEPSTLGMMMYYLINKENIDYDNFIRFFEFIYPDTQGRREHALSLFIKLLNDNPNLSNLIDQQELVKLHPKTKIAHYLYEKIEYSTLIELTHLLLDMNNKGEVIKKLTQYYNDLGLAFIDRLLTNLIIFMSEYSAIGSNEELKALINLREVLIEFIERNDLYSENFESEFEEIEESLIKATGTDLINLLDENDEEGFLKRVNSYYLDYDLKFVYKVVNSLIGFLLQRFIIEGDTKRWEAILITELDLFTKLKELLNKFIRTNSLPESTFNSEFDIIDKELIIKATELEELVLEKINESEGK